MANEAGTVRMELMDEEKEPDPGSVSGSDTETGNKIQSGEGNMVSRLLSSLL